MTHVGEFAATVADVCMAMVLWVRGYLGRRNQQRQTLVRTPNVCDTDEHSSQHIMFTLLNFDCVDMMPGYGQRPRKMVGHTRELLTAYRHDL